jgi:hypothetical protein
MAVSDSTFSEGSPAYASLFGFLGVMGAMVFTGLWNLREIYAIFKTFLTSFHVLKFSFSLVHGKFRISFLKI